MHLPNFQGQGSWKLERKVSVMRTKRRLIPSESIRGGTPIRQFDRLYPQLGRWINVAHSSVWSCGKHLVPAGAEDSKG
ncbi:unnamed protein product [Calypogeia fissa]